MPFKAFTRDPLTPRQRSRVMAKVKARGNRSTEVALAIAFRRAGITGWRRHLRVKYNTLSSCTRSAPAKDAKANYTYPDFVFPGLAIAVYVDGCFWHGCPRHRTFPTHNSGFWRTKLKSNKARDSRVTVCLRKAGWTVVRIWEHTIKTSPEDCVRHVSRAIAESLRTGASMPVVLGVAVPTPMAQTAAHLVDHVIPPVSVRQWVISVPKRRRSWLATALLPGRPTRDCPLAHKDFYRLE